MNDEQKRQHRELKTVYKKTSIIKECFYHKTDECRGDIKQSHSIQRNGRLSIIEGDVNGNQSLYTFTSHISSTDHLIEKLIPIGKKEASTFFGFCDYHDTTLFSPIENFAFDNSDEHNFLHSYRSFAHSYHRKKEENKIYNDPYSEFTKAIPKSWVSTMQEGIKMAINDSAKRKQQFDCFIENKFMMDLNIWFTKNRAYTLLRYHHKSHPEFHIKTSR